MTLDAPEAPIFAAVIAAVVAVVGVVAALLTAEINRRQRANELFYKSLEFLGGGTQNRNLGIAAIQLYGKRGNRRRVSLSLLIGAAIYLLEGSDQGSRANERYNLDRIMTLLLGQRRIPRDLTSSYSALLDVVKRKRAKEFRAGLHVSDECLADWDAALRRLLGCARPPAARGPEAERADRAGSAPEASP